MFLRIRWLPDRFLQHKVSGEILSAKTDIRKSERQIKAIDTTLSHIANHGAYKEVYKKYASIGWKTRKEKFAAEHREELDAYLAAKRFFKAHQEELPFDTKELKKEREQLSGELSEKNEGLQAVQADMKLLRDVRYWIKDRKSTRLNSSHKVQSRMPSSA